MNSTITKRLKRREVDYNFSSIFPTQCQINKDLLERLELETKLEGHTGCVNCLDWNEGGSLLASGSDDTNVIIWNPFTHQKLKCLKTSHHGNIFSVKFYPNTDNKIIATGAGDCHVYIHDVNYNEKVHGYTCNGRVKRIVASQGAPHYLWSASEDGVIREFDLRISGKSCTKTLIDLSTICGLNSECKALAINPTQPHILAVGSNDPYVRLYDRRMIKTAFHMPPQNGQKRKDNLHNSTFGCASYFVPGHLPQQCKLRSRFKYLCSTFLTFNKGGNELLANIGGEHVYLFDIVDKQQTIYKTIDNHLLKPNNSNGKIKRLAPDEGMPGYSGNYSSAVSMPSHMLSTEAENLKTKANDLFARQMFSSSIMVYNTALDIEPKSAVLYANRAAAYIKRLWDGDLYAALRDCETALLYNPNHFKANFRLARCLYELNWVEEAQSCIQDFKLKHAQHSKSKAFIMLERDIKHRIKNPDKKAQKNDEQLDNEEELKLQSEACDYKQRYCGHCNTTTDIKEANFFGSNGQYIIAGSDDASFFIWEQKSSNLVRVMRADDAIVNCIQPHPSICMLATSGIDAEVKLWSPSSGENIHVFKETMKVAAANQMRMNTDPLETMLLSMGMIRPVVVEPDAEF